MLRCSNCASDEEIHGCANGRGGVYGEHFPFKILKRFVTIFEQAAIYWSFDQWMSKFRYHRDGMNGALARLWIDSKTTDFINVAVNHYRQIKPDASDTFNESFIEKLRGSLAKYQGPIQGNLSDIVSSGRQCSIAGLLNRNMHKVEGLQDFAQESYYMAVRRFMWFTQGFSERGHARRLYGERVTQESYAASLRNFHKAEQERQAKLVDDALKGGDSLKKKIIHEQPQMAAEEDGVVDPKGKTVVVDNVRYMKLDDDDNLKGDLTKARVLSGKSWVSEDTHGLLGVKKEKDESRTFTVKPCVPDDSTGSYELPDQWCERSKLTSEQVVAMRNVTRSEDGRVEVTRIPDPPASTRPFVHWEDGIARIAWAPGTDTSQRTSANSGRRKSLKELYDEIAWAPVTDTSQRTSANSGKRKSLKELYNETPREVVGSGLGEIIYAPAGERPLPRMPIPYPTSFVNISARDPDLSMASLNFHMAAQDAQEHRVWKGSYCIYDRPHRDPHVDMIIQCSLIIGGKNSSLQYLADQAEQWQSRMFSGNLRFPPDIIVDKHSVRLFWVDWNMRMCVEIGAVWAVADQDEWMGLAVWEHMGGPFYKVVKHRKPLMMPQRYDPFLDRLG
jgi:hypothetical protein